MGWVWFGSTVLRNLKVINSSLISIAADSERVYGG
jgi:hypothetical protein